LLRFATLSAISIFILLSAFKMDTKDYERLNMKKSDAEGYDL
jgi:hypothetical protein